VDDGVDPLDPVVDHRERLDGLAEVGEVDATEGAEGLGRRHEVGVGHLVAVGQQVFDAGAAGLAAAAGDDHAGHACASSRAGLVPCDLMRPRLILRCQKFGPISGTAR
jgi:hypothetical protein